MFKTKKNKSKKCKSKKCKSKKCRQHGGEEVKINIEYILDSINKDPFEICGYINEKGEHYMVAQGAPKSETNHSASCPSSNYRKMWHTHSFVSKYYPSWQDISKVIKHASVEESIIYTKFGYWTLSCINNTNLEKSFEKKITDILNSFYFNTGNGREYNIEQIRILIINVKEYVSTLIEGFDITWTNY